jgi:hypothetical protein
MKTAEDEAFEDIERRQGGFPAKRAMAADKLHWSDCAVHNGPAYPAGECDCGVAQKTEREALKLALEVMQINLTLLEKIDPYKGQEDLLSDSLELTHEAIASVETVLAQPAQEPVGQVGAIGSDGFVGHIYDDRKVKTGDKLYTTPPKREWVGLTEEEIKELSEMQLDSWDLILEVEAKLKEKNDAT